MPTSFAEEMNKLGEAYTAPFVKLMEEVMKGTTLEEAIMEAERGGSSSKLIELPVIHLLVDGDLVAYRASAAAAGVSYRYKSNKFKYMKQAKAYCTRFKLDPKDIIKEVHTEPEANAIHNVESIINRIAQAYAGFDAKFHLYLSGNTNFRIDVSVDYKKNRAGLARPVHLDACKQHLVNKYGAVISDGCEADDLISIHAHKLYKADVSFSSVSLDKDFDMIPGEHFNWVKDRKYTTNPHEGLMIFYRQVLTGDNVDNIPGLKKVGPKTAEKILPNPEEGAVWWTKSEMYTAVVNAYLKRLGKEKTETDKNYLIRCIKQVTKNARQLWLQTSEGELWQPPKIDKTRRVQKYVDNAMKLASPDEHCLVIEGSDGVPQTIALPDDYERSVQIAGKALCEWVDDQVLQEMKKKAEDVDRMEAIYKEKYEIDKMEKEAMAGRRRSAVMSHKSMEEARALHKMREEELMYKEKFAKEYEGHWKAMPDPEYTNRMKIGKPVHLKPVAILTDGEPEKSPETKREKALSRVIKYAKSLKW